MARVCAFVFNPVIRDARVVKQANSLAAMGHDVTVIGLADNNHAEASLTLDSGVEVIRVARGVGQGASNAGVFGKLAKIPRRIRDQHLYMLALPFLFIAIAWAGLFGTLRERAEKLLGLSVTLILLLGVVYLVANLGKVIDAVVYVSRTGLRLALGRRRSERLFSNMVERLRRKAPHIFEQEVERRTQARIDEMVRIAQVLGPDIVHCHDAHTLPVGAKLKSSLGCKVVYDAHEIYEEIAQGNAETARRYRRIHDQCLPAADGFVTINDSIAGWYKDNYPAIPEPAVVMNATLFTPPFEYDGRLHDAVGLNPDDKILLYQGGFATKRGLELLVESASFLPADWTLVMMGWGRLEDTLVEIGERVNARTRAGRDGDAVRFLPAVPQAELPYWSAGATIGVIPYENVGLNHWFCTPNKLWEYPNAGVPVLVSPYPELRKPVEKYDYGWLLPEPVTPQAIAEAISGISEDEIERARLACHTFNENENWSKYEDRLVALYDELLDAPGSQRSNTPALVS